jgi:hypothetical protein
LPTGFAISVIMIEGQLLQSLQSVPLTQYFEFSSQYPSFLSVHVFADRGKLKENR